jgi:hypothetical protein
MYSNTPSFKPAGGTTNITVNTINPFVAILPYIDNAPLYDRATSGIHGNTGLPNSGNLDCYNCQAVPGITPSYTRWVRMKVYECPSDPGIRADGRSKTDTDWAASSYALNAQIFCTTASNSWVASYGITTIKDGASNTVMIAEKYAACRRSAAPTGASVANGNGGNTWMRNGDWPNLPAFAVNHRSWLSTADTPIAGTLGATNSQAPNWYMPPQFQPTSGVNSDVNQQCDHSRPSTGHTECVVGMADGSVRQVGRKVSQTTWMSAILPANGVPLGSDW